MELRARSLFPVQVQIPAASQFHPPCLAYPYQCRFQESIASLIDLLVVHWYLDEVDPKLLETYNKLGIPLHEQKMLAGVAVDAVFDSVSVATTFKDELKKHGVIFMPFSEAVQHHPDLIEKYLGSVVPYTDNYFATLNSAVFSDGSFVYIPKGVRCPLELSTYFRINASQTGQFERIDG